MADSIGKLQKKLLQSGYLDSLSDNRSIDDFAELPLVQQMMIAGAADFIIAVKKNLNRLGKVSSGALEDGISAGEIQVDGDELSIDVGYKEGSDGAEYYDFVNKGVQGYDKKASKNNDSPYSFKKYTNKRGGISIGIKFRKSIEGWVARESIASSNEDQTKRLTKLQKKRKNIKEISDANDNKKTLAYAIAVNIKKKGLKKTSFFDKAYENVFGQKYIDAMLDAFGAEVEINFNVIDKKYFDGDNNNR